MCPRPDPHDFVWVLIVLLAGSVLLFLELLYNVLKTVS